MTENVQFSIHITGPDFEKAIDLIPGPFTIGREPGNNLVLINPLISRHHARIDCDNNECHLTDLNSSNGTNLNSEKLTPSIPYPLEIGAIIKIGPFEIKLEGVLQEETETIPPQDHEPEQQEPADIQIPIAKQTDALPQEALSAKPAESHSDEPPPPPDVPGEPPTTIPPSQINPQVPPPGLTFTSTKLIDYLPGIYQNDFTNRFLALFESILFPIEWNVDNFDLFLDPSTAPYEFLPWLMNWFAISFDNSWDENQRRKLLKEAHKIFARRGTRWALSYILEIYLGKPPEIIEDEEGLAPYTFKVKLPVSQDRVNQELVERLINANKPAYTAYSIVYSV